MAPSLLRIERMNYVFGGILCIVAGITQPRSVAFGIAIGVALTCLNFAGLRRIVEKATTDASMGSSTNRLLLIMPKMMVLMAAIILVLKFLPVSAAGVAIGYSVFVVSITIEAVYSVMAPAKTRDFPDETGIETTSES
jgi:ATP synthase I chain